MKRNSQSGVALVITLILLSVITFMAISFLVISRREAASAEVLGNRNAAINADEQALQSAIAQATAQMLASTNGYAFGMLVSTNLDQPTFINSGPGVATITNVSYNGLTTIQDLLQNLRNQQILPRVPVFIKTTIISNGVVTPVVDFRFYLDLNRNGRFDPSGWITVTNDAGNPVGLNGPNQQPYITNYVMGDPQWIGVLEHPDQPHSSSNKFIGRYCFLALPIGNSLDINFIHNQAKLPSPLGADGFFRDENVAPWELNLAGFLASLNANQWNSGRPGLIPYYYNPFNSASSDSTAFGDAAAILQARYTFANNTLGYNNLNSFANMYSSSPGLLQFQTNNIDAYAHGGFLMTGFFPPSPIFNPVGRIWSGSDNPNTFFTPADLFNLVPSSGGVGGSFSNRLYQAGLTPPLGGLSWSTYNQYTYYRLLQQMSFDFAPETTRTIATAALDINGNIPGGNIVTSFAGANVVTNPLNLNYINVNGISETNFIPWTTTAINGSNIDAAMFFTNCADRLIRQAFPNPVVVYCNGQTNVITLSVTNIPIYPVNFYTPAMHRLLQLAANIYDATTTRVDTGLIYPSVFRPTFNLIGTNVFINGYVEVNAKTANISLQQPVLALPDQLALVTPNTFSIYSAPWIVGAKKGFPNFNEFAMNSVVQITRKVQIDKVTLGNPRSGWLTNQMYIIGVSNILGVEFWNSYASNYNRPIFLQGSNQMAVTLRNDQGIVVNGNYVFRPGVGGAGISFIANQWRGFADPLHPQNPSKNAQSYYVPLQTNVLFLPDSIWHMNPPSLLATTGGNVNKFEQTGTFPLPRFTLSITNRLRYFLRDSTTGRILDYVQLDGANSFQDLLAESIGTNGSVFTTLSAPSDIVWDTNRPGGTFSTAVAPNGINNQIAISLGNITTDNQTWSQGQLPGGGTKQNEISAFQAFINSTNGKGGLIAQVPYTPTRKIVLTTSLQANDPLVHYTLGDLAFTNSLAMPLPGTLTNGFGLTNAVASIGTLNTRYSPWPAANTTSADPNAASLAVKDPLIRCSDDWQFPNNVFANVGWIGRVHRGTPWQTVYLKSAVANITNWINYSGHTNPYVAALTHPMNDWRLLDLFTTAPNDNATRGQLSINNGNEAAWHAVLDGLVVITNSSKTNYDSIVLDPNANAPALNALINGPGGINATRLRYPASISALPVNYVYTRTNQVLSFPQNYNYSYANYTFVTNYFGGTFNSLGQILATPQLTEASPFLNTGLANSGALFSLGNQLVSNPTLLSDAAYERIPQQMLSLVRVGSPRYVIFSFGQSLKPADHSVYQAGGPYFGMVTNYAISGESVTRTVVDFPNQITPPSQVVPVFPPVMALTTNYMGIALPPAQPPPNALVKAHNTISPQ